jgi:hypothetical protein
MKPTVAFEKGSREKIVLAVIILICASFHACKKTDGPEGPPPLPEEPHTKVGRLKEITAEHLPNPYFAFDYTDDGVTTDISFASGFFIYKLSYANGRLDRMVNQFNGNALVYHYTNGKVTTIRDIRPDNTVLWNYSFDYDVQNQLKEVRWYRFTGDPGNADSLLFRKVELFYHSDGNLWRYDDYRDITGAGLEWSQRAEYADFDSARNVDDFSILKEFFDNLLYLPGVRLQRNNPRNEYLINAENDFEITNTWQYNDGVPVSKSARVRQTRGSDAGRDVTVGKTYTYY